MKCSREIFVQIFQKGLNFGIDYNDISGSEKQVWRFICLSFNLSKTF